MKHSAEIMVYIHAQRAFDGEIKFSAIGCDMSEYGYTLLQTQNISIGFDVPDDFNLDAEEIKSLRAEQKKIQAEAQRRLTQIEERIQSLQSLEYKAAA